MCGICHERDNSDLYLCVKRIKLELVDTLECFGVDLLECDSVLCPLEDVDLLHDVQPALCEVALPGDGHLGLVIPLGGLLVLCIGKNNKGDPELEKQALRRGLGSCSAYKA